MTASKKNEIFYSLTNRYYRQCFFMVLQSIESSSWNPVACIFSAYEWNSIFPFLFSEQSWTRIDIETICSPNNKTNGLLNFRVQMIQPHTSTNYFVFSASHVHRVSYIFFGYYSSNTFLFFFIKLGNLHASIYGFVKEILKSEFYFNLLCGLWVMGVKWFEVSENDIAIVGNNKTL